MSEKVEKLQELAADLAQKYGKEVSKLDERVDSLHKWILASCLSINGVALSLVFTMEIIDDRSQFFSAVWFATGIVSCVLYAMVINSLLSKASLKLRIVTIQFERFVRDKDEIPDFMEDGNPLDSLAKWERIVDWCQYVALVCFVIGISVLGYGIP